MTEPAAWGGRVVGVSLKMYLGLEQTRAWLRGAAEAAGRIPTHLGLTLFVLPSFPFLGDARDLLSETGIGYGGQNVFWEDSGPYTGEVSASILRDLGCRYAEVGHAERRTLFGEDDAAVARKAAAAARWGLTPVVCVGESAESSPADAVDECVIQLRAVLEAVPDDAELVVAYEPTWAIGADSPASVEHVGRVTTELRTLLVPRAGRTALIYGGGAGAGTFSALAQHVDGLFLGRRAHDIMGLREILAEIATATGKNAWRRRMTEGVT